MVVSPAGRKPSQKAAADKPATPLDTLTEAVRMGQGVNVALLAYLTARGHNRSPSTRVLSDVWHQACTRNASVESRDLEATITRTLGTIAEIAVRCNERLLAVEAIMLARPGTTHPKALRAWNHARANPHTAFETVLDHYAR
jgi:hypothetical protein